eukprot:6673798-Prymnesium_polylepis.1
MDFLGQGRTLIDGTLRGSNKETLEQAELRFSLDIWAEQLVDYIETQHKGKKVHLVGNSVGGTIALIASGRVKERVASVALINLAPFWPPDLWGPEGSPVWDGTLPAPSILRALIAFFFELFREKDTVSFFLGL